MHSVGSRWHTTPSPAPPALLSWAPRVPPLLWDSVHPVCLYRSGATCPVPGWTPCAHDLDMLSCQLAASAAQNVLRSLMSRERDLARPVLPLPVPVASGMEPSSQGLDTSHLPPLPVWPGHSPSASPQALLSHTWMPALVTPQAHGPGTHHALVRDSLLLKALVASRQPQGAPSTPGFPLAPASLSARPKLLGRRPGLLCCLQLHWRTGMRLSLTHGLSARYRHCLL